MRGRSQRSIEEGVEVRVLYLPLERSAEAMAELTARWRIRYLEQLITEGEPQMWWCYLELTQQGDEPEQQEPLKQTSPEPSPRLSTTPLPSPSLPSTSHTQAHTQTSSLKERVMARVERRRQREDPPLLDEEASQRQRRLLEWRRDVARQEKRARYMILTNLQAAQIAALNPSTLKQLKAIRGIGDYKLRAYGEAILRLMSHTYRYQPPPYDPLAEDTHEPRP